MTRFLNPDGTDPASPDTYSRKEETLHEEDSDVSLNATHGTFTSIATWVAWITLLAGIVGGIFLIGEGALAFGILSIISGFSASAIIGTLAEISKKIRGS